MASLSVPASRRVSKGKGKKKDTRKYHVCPLCTQPFKKLSQHIKGIHGEIRKEEREQMCEEAPVCSPNFRSRSPHQSTISTIFQRSDDLSIDLTETGMLGKCLIGRGFV